MVIWGLLFHEFATLDLTCTSQSQAGVVSISCEANTPLVSPSECTLTSDSTAFTFPCELWHHPKCVKSIQKTSGNASDVVVDIEDFPPGEYNLTVRVRDENGQTGITEVESLPLSGTIT